MIRLFLHQLRIKTNQKELRIGQPLVTKEAHLLDAQRSIGPDHDLNRTAVGVRTTLGSVFAVASALGKILADSPVPVA